MFYMNVVAVMKEASGGLIEECDSVPIKKKNRYEFVCFLLKRETWCQVLQPFLFIYFNLLNGNSFISVSKINLLHLAFWYIANRDKLAVPKRTHFHFKGLRDTKKLTFIVFLTSTLVFLITKFLPSNTYIV